MENRGFTIVELLVAMTLTLVVMAGIYGAYHSQQKTAVAQEQVADMQQNLRAAMYYMSRELRMAGCDPSGTADAGITAAGPSSISLTEDIRGDTRGSDPDGDVSDPNEAVTYNLSGGDLQRNGNTIANDIDALNFVYLDEDDNPLDDDGNGNVVASIKDIRSVQIAAVARTGRRDRGYTDTQTYTNLRGETILASQNDGFRRQCLKTEVRCRNLGLR